MKASSGCRRDWRRVRGAVVALTIASAALITARLGADPTTSPGDSAEGVFGEGLSKGHADSRSGAMTWSYPFSLPAARGGPQPRLSLNYHSSSRDREAGYGWGLDLPVIERKPLSGYPCATAAGVPIACGEQSPTAPSEERYAFSGQPLVLICRIPASPMPTDAACGDEKHPAWARTGGWRYFRLQVEGAFARFYLAESRRYWRMQAKGGELLEFGEPPDASGRGVERDRENARSILRWRLVRHSDTLHRQNGKAANYVEYRWKALGKRGLLFLTDILDTPRAAGHMSDADFAHHTQLSWELPDFPQTHYADPYHATPDLRLARVAVSSMPWSGTGPREVIRSYSLRYLPAQGPTTNVPLSQVFRPWRHTFLGEIQMQGRCGHVEDERGDIPQRGECRGSLTPATRFEYEDGWPGFGIASMTRVQGGPPKAVEQDRVLPFISSVGIVDFNRDGLPDIVQGWKPSLGCATDECDEGRPMIGYLNRGTGIFVNLQHQCFDAGRADDTTGLTHYALNTRDGFFTNRGGATLVAPWSEGVLAWSNAQFASYRARPVPPAYALSLLTLTDTTAIPNTGTAVVIVARIGASSYVRIFDAAGARVHNQRAIEFLPEQTLALIDDAFAAPLPPQMTRDLTEQILSGTAYDRPFDAGSGCDVDNFSAAAFKPGWKWEKTQSAIDWAKPPVGEPPAAGEPTGGHGRFFRLPRWFVDVDGDGLVDRMDSTGEQALDFETAYVQFTQRYPKGAALPGGGTGPAQIPFVFDGNQRPHSLVPSFAGSESGTRYWYVDINGDGLVDLVTYNPGGNGGIPQVRPGNGRGGFSCIDVLQPWACQEPSQEVARIYGIDVAGPIKPWPFNDETLFHDVTGDGLADIVRYDMPTGEVRVWVNQDGHAFACAIASCVAGKVLNAHAEERGLSGAAAWDIGEHRTTFADMNADGIDDIVVLARTGAYVGVFMEKYVVDSSRGSAPRPGLLIRIHNGYGATTDIQYQSIQQLDLDAAKDPVTAWRWHVPVVDAVVTQITTQDTYHAGGDSSAVPLSAPYQFKRMAQYLYQDPAYDRWSRSFVGFRKVSARYGIESATTTATYAYGNCQNNRLNARLPSTPDIPLCEDGSDDDDYKSLSGRIVRIDRGNEFLGVFNQRFATPRFAPPPVGGPKLLWTRMFHYTQVTLFQTPERRVTFAYPGQIDSFLYDDAQPTSSAGGASPGFGAGGDRLQDAPHQKNVRKHLRQVQEYDTRGVLRRTVDHGAIKDADSAPADREDATVVTLFSSGDPATSNDAALIPCTEDWVCQPSYVSVWQPQPGGPFDTLLRKSRFTYNASQDVESVSDWLDEAAPPLDRHHPAGAANVAPAPPGQSLARGWHTLLTATYDPFGNIVKAAATPSAGGSPAECTTFEPDRAYAQLTEFVRKFVDGCGGQAHTFQTVYDRGFGLVTQVRDAGGGLSAVRYDALGRPLEIHRPAPDDRPGAPPVLSETFTYSDRAPLSHVESRRFVGPGTAMRSVTILNGLGEPVLRFNKGDAGGDWILSEWTETDLSGRVRQIRRPWITTSDPVASAASASAFAIPVDNALLEIQYDGFGRRVSLKETAGGVTQELSRIAYSPLAMEVRDAEQLKSGSVHSSAFQRIEFDGRGRNVLSKVHVANPAADDIITRVDYAPTGEVVKASRVHRGGSYERTMKYDTLGRLVRNEEPNTGKNWRYVWDGSGRLVGMSDARGCGENFYYDGLNRLVGEDYSPCLASQPAYTAPDLDTGAGFEALYRYDSYEADQIQPEPGFADDARAAIGRLVSFSDRGSHTRFNYDARGRLRRIARQVATPGSTGADSFAQHWFSSRMDYDIGDRVTRRTTGADIPELLVAGSSEERYAYSPRGNLMSVDSSYGSLIKSASFDARDAPTRIVFGDARSTTARFAYDARHRLSMYQLIAPSTPAAPPIGYFDYRFPEYDAVGNPLVIQDLRIAWTVLPADAAPVETRKMDYDDLYRVTGVANAYKTFDGTAPWSSPFAAENAAGDTRPLPLRSLPKRITRQQFTYDGLGNLTASSDDASAVFDRSLGPGLAYGTAQDGPNQLRSGNGLKLRYDAAGNMTELTVERPGTCPSGAASACAQRFVYDWDEVGQLARARRWDFPGNSIPASSSPAVNVKPAWDLAYAYSQGGRVRKTVTDPAGDTRHTLEIFDTLRVNSAAFDAAARDYRANRRNMQTYLAGMGQAFWDDSGVLPHQPGTSGVTMHLSVGDHLGSSSVVINHATSELVERSTYQPYGAVESDHRPAKWRNFRDAYKFTGKEEDIEAGIVYFGARYYQPYLGRFISADPLTVHGMGADMNPYGYVSGRVTTRIDPIGLAECTPGTMCMPEGQPEDVITGRRPPPDPTPSSDPTPPNTPGLPGPSAPSAGTAGSATGSAPKAPREMLTFERGDPNAIQKPTRGDLIKAAVVQVAQDTALNLVDPVHTNRHFVKDIITITDDKASPLSKGIAGGSAVLSVIPVVGELRVGSVALKEIAASARTSEELARLVSLVGNSGPQQTVAVLETAEGIRLVGAGVRDLSPAQRIFARAYGLVPVKLAGAHAEGTVLEAAWFKGLRPLRGVTTVDACPVCAPMLKDGSFGWIFEYVTPRIFIVK